MYDEMWDVGCGKGPLYLLDYNPFSPRLCELERAAHHLVPWLAGYRLWRRETSCRSAS